MGDSGEMLNGLWVICRPETGNGGDPIAFPTHPLLSSWLVAVSHSARQRGCGRHLPPGTEWFGSETLEEVLLRLPTMDVVVFSPLSLNSLAKMALGIRDSLPSRIFGVAAEQGAAILLDKTALPTPETAMNPHLAKIYRRHWEAVTGGSIGEFVADDLDLRLKTILRLRREGGVAASPAGRQVITRDDVLAARNGVGRLKVPRGSLITDLAREEAEKWGIRLEVL